MDNVQQMVEALGKLVREGGGGNYLIFLADPARNVYCQFAAGKGDTTLHAELTGNDYLAPADQLGDEERSRLRALGWTLEGDGMVNPWRKFHDVVADEARGEVARECLEALAVYGVGSGARLEVTLELTD